MNRYYRFHITKKSVCRCAIQIISCIAFLGAMGLLVPPADAKPVMTLAPSVEPQGVDVNSVLMQFPDDTLYTKADINSSTGRTVFIRKSQFPDDYSLEGLKTGTINGKDGFSPAGPVFFKVEGHPDESSLYHGGLDNTCPIKIYNLSTGKEVKISVTRVQASDDADIIYAYPVGRFHSGKHIALVTKGLKSNGVAVKDSPFLEPFINTHPESDKILYFLKNRNIEKEDLISLRVFTVASADSYKKPVDEIVKKIEASTPDYCGGSTEQEMVVKRHVENSLPYYKAKGKLNFQQFFNKQRGMLISKHKIKHQCVEFTIFYPKGYKNPGPVLLLGHPLNGSIDTSMRYIYPALKQGYAVIGIDFPYHGSRGRLKYSLEGLWYLFNQGAADMFSLSHSLGTTLSTLDLFPKDGRADLDQERVSYLGISLGSILGQLTVAKGGIKSAYFKTGGVNIGEMIALGKDFEFFRRLIVPKEFNKQKEAAFLAMLQGGFILDGAYYMDEIVSNYSAPSKGWLL